jgi:hypothetical protein
MPASRKAHKVQRVVVGLILMAGLLGVPQVSAQEAGTWQRGTLVGLETRTTTSEGVRNEHYEERQTKNGKKEFNGYSYAPDQTTVTYVLTVTVGDITYTAEHTKNLFFGYNPTDMVVNDPVTVSRQKNRLVLKRPDGKEYKTTIVRLERNTGSTPAR